MARDNGELMFELDGETMMSDAAANMGWRYTGAWSLGGFGIGEVGSFDPPTSDPLWAEFGWDQLYRIGPFWDDANGGNGGPIFMDDVYIGGPNVDLSAATQPTTAMSGVSFSANGEVNTISWSEVEGAGGYNVYASRQPITDIDAENVTLLKRVLFDEPTSLDHRVEVPHPSIGAFTVYYAVTTLSQFGVENPDVSMSAGSVSNSELEQRAYIRQLETAEADNIFDDLDAGNVTDASFPADQPVFVVDSDHRTVVEGTVTPTDEDVSARVKIGYTTAEEWFVYAEIMDDDVRLAQESTSGGETYLFDSMELAFGHYDVRNTEDGGDLLIGSPHQDMQRGDEPDYQIRITGRVDGNDDIVGSSTNIGFSIDEDFENATVVDRMDGGWKFLSLIPMDQIQNAADGDVLLPAPDRGEIQFIPFTISINDADATGQRESQIILSVKPNVTNQWWNTPAQWEVVAIAGRDVAPGVEDGTPRDGFSLAQTVPNPASTSAEIGFTLGKASDVQVEVFNALGQRVAVVANETMAAGERSVTLNTSGLAPGVYVYRLSAGDYVATRRMTVVR